MFLPTHFYEHSVSVSISNSELSLGLRKCLPSRACQECHADEHPSVSTRVTTVKVTFNTGDGSRWCRNGQNLFWNYRLLQPSSQEVTRQKWSLCLEMTPSVWTVTNQGWMQAQQGLARNLSLAVLYEAGLQGWEVLVRRELCALLSPVIKSTLLKLLMDNFSRSTQWGVWNRWF